jgi:asparagine synthetase B (glutamine-hydrolysing)
LLCIFGGDEDGRKLLDTIDPLKLAREKTIERDGGFIAVSYHDKRAISEEPWREGERFTACLGGDLVGLTSVPWREMLDGFRQGKHSRLVDLRGFFALIVHDREAGKLYLVSDRLSMYPVFYGISGKSIAISTSLSTFSKMNEPPPVSEEWLYEYFYFSFPMGQRTFFEGVSRMPPASVLEFDLETGEHHLHEYASRFMRCALPFLKGKKSVKRAVEVSRDIVRRYYGSGVRFAHPVTCGFDTRSLLAFLPNDQKSLVQAYTYGIPGSKDVEGAKEVARAMGLDHKVIPFDEEFHHALPELARDTVRLSGGQENINRSYLFHMHRTLGTWDGGYPYVIGGIGGLIFQAGVPVPNIISGDMQRSFVEGRRIFDKDFFRKIFGDRFDRFEQHIEITLEWLNGTYGRFDSLLTYFMYLIYEAIPKYYGGEMSISRNFTALRIPFLDPDIIELSFEVEQSLLAYERYADFDIYSKHSYLAGLIKSNPVLAQLPINGLPLRAYASNSSATYNMYRLLKRTPRKIASFFSKHSTQPPMEDWHTWYRTVLSGEFDNLLHCDSIVAQHLDLDFIERIKREKTNHWLKLTATAEKIMRLAHNGWEWP